MGIWYWFTRRRRAPLDQFGPATSYLSQTGAYSPAYASTWATQPTIPLSTVGQLTFGQARLYNTDEEQIA